MYNTGYGGVFYFKSGVLRPKKAPRAATRAMLVSVVAGLMMVASFSSILHVVDRHITEGQYFENKSAITEFLRKISGVTVAEAATTGNALDRDDYYNANAKLFAVTPTPSPVKAVTPVKTTAKATPVSATVKTTTPASKTTATTASAVKPAVVSVPAPTPAKPAVQAAPATPKAVRMIQTANSLTLGTNEVTSFSIGYKNSGTTAWKVGSMRVYSAAKTESWLHEASWDSRTIAASLKAEVKPGEIGYFTFKIAAPAKVGSYSETFSLYEGTTKIAGTELVLPLTVVAQAPKATLVAAQATPSKEAPKTASVVAVAATTPETTTTPSTPSATKPNAVVVKDLSAQEPMIRVGIYVPVDPVLVTANKPYEVRDTSGTLLASEVAGTVSTAIYDRTAKQYVVMTPSATVTSALPVRFTAVGAPTMDAEIVFTINSYSNRPSWNKNINYNEFRNVLELRLAPKSDKVWVINELSVEYYLRGLGETSNSSPAEYQKALVTAARTYAQYHINRATKYTDEGFNVRDTDADQVYNGYTSEVIQPNVVAAVEATRGVHVYYDGKLAITPYFSQSDGRTRNWTEVWGGAGYPWLVSVEDPTNAGLTLWGHGVGMSAVGALRMANAGSIFEEILTHYYTGVELRQMYQ